MGVSYSADVVLGIRCKQDDFVKKIGEKKRCQACGDRYDGPQVRYCPRDGCPLIAVPVFEATPGLVAYTGSTSGRSALQVYEWLCVGYSAPRDRIALFDVRPLRTPDDESDGEQLALGYLFQHVCPEAEGSSLSVKAYSLAEFQARFKCVEDTAKILGITSNRGVEVFLSMQADY